MKNNLFLCWALLCSNLIGYSQQIDHWETAIFKTDTWRYFVGTAEPDTNWRKASFNDSSWPQGIGGFGRGDNDDGTTITQAPSVYLRIKFTISDTSKLLYGLLQMDYDDAFVAYLNNKEIARVGISGTHPLYNHYGNDHEATIYRGGAPENFLLDKNKLRYSLLQGENILVVQVHNSSATSSDMSSNVFLSFGISDASLLFRNTPEWFTPPLIFTSSYLPIVVITTKSGETIMDEPKITADMKIIHHGGSTINNVTDPGTYYNGKIGIEIRGSYSASLPQKPYGIETRDTLGNNLDVSLLGMPYENDWVLLANYNDKAFLRNYLASDIFRKMGYYAPRTQYCEVVVNNDYQGIYLFGEKIKRDKNRVNISKLTPEDNTGDSVTGGYIFKNDYYGASDSWLSNFSPVNRPGAQVYFVYHDPKPEELTPQQKTYLQSFVNSLETALYGPNFKDPTTGYRAYLHVNSFIDYFIIGELSRNVDAYKKSRFYYKTKDSKDRLLYSGPVWDYDWAWRNLGENCIHMNQTDGSGWAYKINECGAWPTPPSWEVRMMQDSSFANAINARYFALRKNILSLNYINQVIDSVATLLDEAQQRHYQKWKILGINVGAPEVDAQPTTFEGDIQKFKNWIATRLAWLDANMVGTSATTVKNLNSYSKLRVFPNPTKNFLYIESDREITHIEIINLTGISMMKVKSDDYEESLDVINLKPGIYLIKVTLKNGTNLLSRFIKE